MNKSDRQNFSPMRRLVLAGAGHAHAQVLRHIAKAASPRLPKNVEVVIISPYRLAPYSGMVPGWLSGRYTFEQIAIDFARLSQVAGAIWIESEIQGIDPDTKTLALADGRQLTYDVLSFNIGSTLEPPETDMLTLRPLASLKDRYDRLLHTWQEDPDSLTGSVSVIGAGAAGFEVLLALLSKHAHLRQCAGVKGKTHVMRSRLITRGSDILPGHNALTRWLANRHLDHAGIDCLTDTPWSQTLRQENDLVVWATGARAHAWQRDTARTGSLAVSEQGYIKVDATLRSVSHPGIFAAGDCAHWEVGSMGPDQDQGLPKAGVYAVRMGPALTHNILASLALENTNPLQTYRPQRQFLTLLNTSDGQAIASRGSLAARGQWAMRWKDRIDTEFVQGFNNLKAT